MCFSVYAPTIWISIHASAREATPPYPVPDIPFPISIHASAREATPTFLQFYCISFISIHASAREATYGKIKNTKDLVFQSTLPRGKRLKKLIILKCKNDFNPRFRKGSDGVGDQLTVLDQISIHASAREATTF